MRKLTLTNIAQIAEIIAAIVIVISILYVGKELNQNTKAMHDDSWQAILDKLIELDMAEAATPEISQVIMRGETSPDSMKDEEWFRFSKFVLARLGILEYGYLSRSANALGDFHWETIELYLQHKVCLPGYQLYWSQSEVEVFHPDYVRYVNGLISNCASDSATSKLKPTGDSDVH